MIWTSNDRLWDRPRQAQGQPLHTGVKPFLDALWPKLAASGTSGVPWSLAVHPYDGGDPRVDQMTHTTPRAYTFATLGAVAAYQRAQVRARAQLDPDTAAGRPYTLLFASEQGWNWNPTGGPGCEHLDVATRARNICLAQSLSARVPEVVGVTHNFFQDSPGGSSQGGCDFGPSQFRGTPDRNESAALHSYGLDSHCRSMLRDPTTGRARAIRRAMMPRLNAAPPAAAQPCVPGARTTCASI